MILAHPATLGTIAWLVLTVALVVAFGGRGVSAVWSISTSLVRGVYDWARGTDAAVERTVSPHAAELPPLPTPGGSARGGAARVINAGAAARWREPHPEVQELDARRLP